MNYVKRVCRVCGKEYNACATPGIGTFRWQDIACSREHYLIYHEQILESRKQQAAEKAENK